MTAAPHYAIVVPAWNEEAIIGQTVGQLRTIAENLGRPYELVVVDDASSDRTAEIADLALEELAEYQGIVLVEWGDVADALFGDHLVVHLEPDLFDDDDQRNALYQAMDGLRDRFGDRIVFSAATLGARTIGRSNPFSGDAPLRLANRHQ